MCPSPLAARLQILMKTPISPPAPLATLSYPDLPPPTPGTHPILRMRIVEPRIPPTLPYQRHGLLTIGGSSRGIPSIPLSWGAKSVHRPECPRTFQPRAVRPRQRKQTGGTIPARTYSPLPILVAAQTTIPPFRDPCSSPIDPTADRVCRTVCPVRKRG